MEKQLSNLNVVELKALAYDQVVQIEMAQNNLRAINQELSRKLNPQNQPPGQPNFGPLPLGSVQTV